MEITYDLASDIPVSVMEDPTRRHFPVRLRNGREVQVHLPTGYEQELILTSTTHSAAELNTMLLGRCVFEHGSGQSVGADGARKLGMADRRKLLEALTDHQPGPKYSELDLECPTCAKKFPINLDISDLFR